MATMVATTTSLWVRVAVKRRLGSLLATASITSSPLVVREKSRYGTTRSLYRNSMANPCFRVSAVAIRLPSRSRLP